MANKLTLRPEATAGICRAYVEHKLHQQPGFVKFYCIGPMFRYERPQAGRFRQFYQIDVEAIGEASPVVDAEVLTMLMTFLQRLGLQQLELHLNSLGMRLADRAIVKNSRVTSAAIWINSARSARAASSAIPCGYSTAKRRAAVPSCATHRRPWPFSASLAVSTSRPWPTSSLGWVSAMCSIPSSSAGWITIRATFEVVAEGLGAQNSVTGGGRYDGLIEAIGGPPTPGIGFAIGFERLVTVLEHHGLTIPEPRPQVFVAPLGASALREAFVLVERLRSVGLRAEMGYDEKSLRSQLRRANRLGAAFTVMLGERELAAGKVALKDMQGGEQEEIPLAEVTTAIAGRAQEQDKYEALLGYRRGSRAW